LSEKSNDKQQIQKAKLNLKAQNVILIPMLIICNGFSPGANAVTPVPDGGYPNFNTAEGQNALVNLDTTTGFANTAVGSFALQSILDSSFNTGVGAGTLSLNTANENTAVGAAALLLNTTGEANTAVGVDALLNNTTGGPNTAIGHSALLSNTGGAQNTATGFRALGSNTTGSFNTANGVFALSNNTAGVFNTASGLSALSRNTTGSTNTADGAEAPINNTEGNDNTAIGASALKENTTGSRNTATGLSALFGNDIGSENTATGVAALEFNHGDGNTAFGISALASISIGNLNTAVGAHAADNLADGDSNNIDIGANVNGVAGESNTIRIGNPGIATTIIRGISGQTIPSGAAVLVAANGQLGTATSSKRFKEQIKPMERASEALFSLKPVTFHYKKRIDPTGTRQFGLVAEDVEKVNPDLVVRDESGNAGTVRYDQVNAMLLNEFLKEHRKVQELEATVARQQNDFQTKLENQGKQIAALATGRRKVSAGLETRRPAQQLVLNNP
jgi:Chaperone of endosialidase